MQGQSRARGGFTGLSNFTSTAKDFRFLPATENIGLYLLVWLAALVILVVMLALMLHGRARRLTAVLRFLYYLPGALAGAASVVLWLFILDPTVSPAAPVLRLLGLHSFAETIEPSHPAGGLRRHRVLDWRRRVDRRHVRRAQHHLP